MEHQMFETIMARFDRLDNMMRDHIADDSKVHVIVGQHQTYWTMTKWFSGTAAIAAIGTYFGLKH